MSTSVKIMYGKEVIAIVSDPYIKFLEGVKDSVKERLPRNFPGFIRWMSERVIPEDRVDIEKVLNLMSIDKYDMFDIAKKTRACLMEDDFWVKFKEEDKWEDNVRARAGYKPIPRKNVFKIAENVIVDDI